MKGLRIKAILLGLAATLGLVLAFLLLFGVGTFVAALFFHLSAAGLQSFLHSPFNRILNLCVGGLISFCGGWITAARASEAPWRNAWALGIVSATLCLPLWPYFDDALWYKIISYAITPPATALGAWMIWRLRPTAQIDAGSSA